MSTTTETGPLTEPPFTGQEGQTTPPPKGVEKVETSGEQCEPPLCEDR